MALLPSFGPKKPTEAPKVRVFWHERPPESSTSIIDEFKARGFNAALWLFLAKRGLKKAMIPTLKKMSKKLHREENDVTFLRSLYATASDRGKLPNVPMAYVFGTWLDRLEMMRYINEYTKGWLPEDSAPILQSGEASGRRAEAVDQYIWMLEQKGLRRKAMIKGLSPPIINILVVVIYFIVIAKFIAPGYEKGLPRDHWKGPLRVVGGIADVINIYILPIAAAVAIFTAIVIWSLPNYTGKYRLWLERRKILPFWYMYKQTVGANFMMSYSALNKTSMAENVIIETLMSSAPKYYRSRLEPVRALTSIGHAIPNALEETGLEFPDKSIISELLDYQSSDDFSKEIEVLAQDWVETSIENLVTKIAAIDMAIIISAYGMIMLIMSADFSYIKQVQAYLGQH